MILFRGSLHVTLFAADCCCYLPFPFFSSSSTSTSSQGMHGSQLEAVVEGKLDQLDLRDFEKKNAGSLSGGNKRKLSVAIATIGEPPIVFLDGTESTNSRH